VTLARARSKVPSAAALDQAAMSEGARNARCLDEHQKRKNAGGELTHFSAYNKARQ
jgi:hypothetical protein